MVGINSTSSYAPFLLKSFTMKASTSPPEGLQGLDAVVPAVAQTVERLESLHQGLQNRLSLGENGSKARSNDLGQLLEKAKTLSELQLRSKTLVEKPGQTAVAASLRQRLAEFQQFAPNSELPAGQSTVQLLANWRHEVSRQETLNEEQSAAVLGALLRGERAIAELQRSEAACARRWAAMSQEAHQLVDRIKGFKGRAQMCQDRQRNLNLAAGHQRKELWSQQLAEVQEGDRGAAKKVYEELLKLDSQCQQLQSAIWFSQNQLHKLDYKRRKALRVLEGSANLGQPNASSGLSVDEVVNAELEAEKLLWELFKAEKPELPAKNPAVQVLETPVVDSLPPTAPASPSFAAEDPLDAMDAVDDPEVSEVVEVAAVPVVTPKVAKLIHRLAMSRDERRQHERDRQAGLVEEPPVSAMPVAPSVADVPLASEGPVEPVAEGPQQLWPELPTAGDPAALSQAPVENLPWKTSSPEVLWGELPSAPLQPARTRPPLREVAPGLVSCLA